MYHLFPHFVFVKQEHIYKLMKSDSYSRFIRSSAYQELLQAKKKVKKTRLVWKYRKLLCMFVRFVDLCTYTHSSLMLKPALLAPTAFSKPGKSHFNPIPNKLLL